MGSELGITPVIIRGEELKQRGFGGMSHHLLLWQLKSFLSLPLFCSVVM